MKIKISHLLVAIGLTLIVLPGQIVYAQLGVLEGKVVDPQGNPIEDVQIRIEGLNVSRKYKVETNDKGEYLHAGVDLQGTYRIIAEREGYQTNYVEGIRPAFRRGDERGIINFTLKPGESRKLAFDMTDEERAELKQKQEEAQQQAEKMAAIRESFNRGVQAYNAGQYQEAVNAFNEAVQKDNQQPAVWANLGNTYNRLGENQKALESYQKAIELDVDNPVYYQNTGSIYASLGDTDKAQEMYEKAAEISSQGDPKGAASSFYNMGITYINSGKSREAAEALKKAVETDPDHAEARYQLGITLVGLNQIDEAITHFQKYLELAPDSQNAEVAKALIEQLKSQQ